MAERVLVTGGAGYIGCVAVRELLKKGYEVKVFDKLFFGKEGLKDVDSRIEIVQGDIRAFDPEILRDIDAIIHLAALSNDPTAEYNPKANYDINTIGTEIVAKAARDAGIERFIFASSCSVYYSPHPTEELVDEETRIEPTAPYSKSKYLAEQTLLKLRNEDFKPTILRQGTVFGYSPRMRYDLVVNTFVKNAYIRGALTANNGGEMYRPLVSVGDIAKAYIACLEAPSEKIDGEIFNVLHKNYIILALAHWIKYVMRDKKDIRVNVEYGNEDNTRSYRVDNTKIKRVLGYSAEEGISPAISEMWEALSNGGGKDIDNPIYYNIKWMDLLNTMGARVKEIGGVFECEPQYHIAPSITKIAGVPECVPQ
jgi:nucleoside-diphosphate-sugar epimerase